MRRFFEILLAAVLCLFSALAGQLAHAAPGGPQAVVYYSDGLKLLKNKLYLSDGTLAFSMGSVSSVGNIAIGESAASASTSYPLLIERTLANFIAAQISNPSSNAAASAKIQLSTDAGDKKGELAVFPNEATTAAYTSAFVVRPTENSTRLSLIGGDLSTGHIAFYVAGDYTTAGEALNIAADKSIHFKQQISTPAQPAAGTAKLYLKSDDGIYYRNDTDSEQRIDSVTSAGNKLRIEMAKVTPTDGTTCTVNTESGDWISSTTPTAAGDCTLNYSSIWSAAPICTITVNPGDTDQTNAYSTRIHSVSTTALRFLVQVDDTGTPQANNNPVHIICIGVR